MKPLGLGQSAIKDQTWMADYEMMGHSGSIVAGTGGPHRERAPALRTHDLLRVDMPTVVTSLSFHYKKTSS